MPRITQLSKDAKIVAGVTAISALLGKGNLSTTSKVAAGLATAAEVAKEETTKLALKRGLEKIERDSKMGMQAFRIAEECHCGAGRYVVSASGKSEGVDFSSEVTPIMLACFIASIWSDVIPDSTSIESPDGMSRFYIKRFDGKLVYRNELIDEGRSKLSGILKDNYCGPGKYSLLLDGKERIVYCSNCKQKLTENQAACPRCGKKAIDPITPSTIEAFSLEELLSKASELYASEGGCRSLTVIKPDKTQAQTSLSEQPNSTDEGAWAAESFERKHITCPNCSLEIPAGSNFCGFCGTKVK